MLHACLLHVIVLTRRAATFRHKTIVLYLYVQAQRWRIVEKINQYMGRHWRRIEGDGNQGRLELVTEIEAEDEDEDEDEEDEDEGEGEGEGESEGEGEGEGEPFYPSTTATGAACTSSGSASTQTIQSIFMTRVMCDFTPRRPRSLPTWKWASLEQQLVDRLQLHAPREVWQLGPNSLRQLITEWYKEHPAFAGLPYSAWGKRLKDMDPQAHPRSLVFKFSFEYTPAGQPLPMPPSPPSRPAGPGGPSSSAGYSATYFGP